MKFGLVVPGLMLFPPTVHPWEEGAPASTPTRVAVNAEKLGYDFVAVTEHLIMTAEFAPAMGSLYVDSLAAVSYLAGATSRIEVLTYALVVPYRHPIALAKSVATVDYLSGGRVILGIGVGQLEGEFDLLGVPFAERGDLTDEYMEAMKELWTNDRPQFEGKYVQFADVVADPKPARKPHPPIWVGGNTRRAIRRAAESGDGWIPWLVGPDELPQALDQLGTQRAAAGRTGDFDVILPLMEYSVDEATHQPTGETTIPSEKDEITATIGKLKEAGATGVLLYFPKTPTIEEFDERMQMVAEEVLPAFR